MHFNAVQFVPQFLFNLVILKLCLAPMLLLHGKAAVEVGHVRIAVLHDLKFGPSNHLTRTWFERVPLPGLIPSNRRAPLPHSFVF